MSEHIDKKLKVEMEPKEPKEEMFNDIGSQVQGSMNNEVVKSGGVDSEGHPVQEIESLCMNCHKNGTTRLLLTRIPFFREIILMSFECPHCNFKNSEMQPASQISEKGSKYKLTLENTKDYNRQLVKSESATIKFDELDIEIPPKRGQLTNLEGVLSEMIQDLLNDQDERKLKQPETFEKINQIIVKIQSYIDGKSSPLTVTVDDPAGNSWIEYNPGEPSHKWSMFEYERTAEQNVFLGLISADDVAQNKLNSSKIKLNSNPISSGFISDESNIENLANEVQTFMATCGSCYQSCDTHMKTVNIPHFKDVIIMSTVCEHCGYKSNEVKTGGAIPLKGKTISLKISDPDDLGRDILKSETCGLNVPELNLDLTPGTLGGRFTTIEGLLTQVKDELHTRVFSQTSDSMDEENKTNWVNFFARLTDAIDGKIPFTVKMRDPLAASYIQNIYAPDADPNMEVEEFERTWDENENLGLNDMKTDQQEIIE